MSGMVLGAVRGRAQSAVEGPYSRSVLSLCSMSLWLCAVAVFGCVAVAVAVSCRVALCCVLSLCVAVAVAVSCRVALRCVLSLCAVMLWLCAVAVCGCGCVVPCGVWPCAVAVCRVAVAVCCRFVAVVVAVSCCVLCCVTVAVCSCCVWLCGICTGCVVKSCFVAEWLWMLCAAPQGGVPGCRCW